MRLRILEAILGAILGGALGATQGAPAQASPTADETAPPPAIHVGDGSIDGGRIHPYDNAWVITVRRDDGTVQSRGMSSDHVQYVTVDGRRYLARVEDTTGLSGSKLDQVAGGGSMTFNLFDPLTFEPAVGEAGSVGGASMRRSFAGRHVVTRERSASGVDKTSEADLPEPVLDFHGGMTGLILAALPLKVGYRATIPAMGDTGFEPAVIRVIGHAFRPIGLARRVETWVVEIGPSPSHSVYWISKTAPYVIKAEVRGPHAVASWDIVDPFGLAESRRQTKAKPHVPHRAD
jgi:hypothetical protein